MCETSNTPASVRTARCSGITPSYCTGISQPANGTMRAPSATWRVVQRRALERRFAVHGRDANATRTAASPALLDRRGAFETREPPARRQSSFRKLGIVDLDVAATARLVAAASDARTVALDDTAARTRARRRAARRAEAGGDHGDAHVVAHAPRRSRRRR